MKIKLDENITEHAKALFERHGHECDSVADEGLAGSSDRKIIDVCRAEGRLLVTFDVGFGDIRAYPPPSHAGIVLLRLRDQRLAGVVAPLRKLLYSHDITRFVGHLVVVTDERVRIRSSE